MDRLWAPWRMEYIENVDKGGCFLCESSSAKDDRKNLILFRGRESFVILNRYPYNSAHLMVSPYKHTPEILALSETCRAEMLTLVGSSMKILTGLLDCEGFNCGMNFGRVAGAGLKDHTHFHVVPRWSGDFNFMPILGETKSMPEYLEETYDRLIGEFSKL